MEGRPWRTRLTLSDLLAVQHASNLRDLLGYREEEDEGQQDLLRRHLRSHGGGGGETLTLASALAYEKGEASSTPAASARTLLDIFREDEGGAAGGRTLLDVFREEGGPVAAGAGDSATWRTFEERLRLSAASTTGGAPPEEASGGEAAVGGDAAAVEQQPVRASLMALMEATEGQMGGIGEVWAVAEEEDEDEDEDEEMAAAAVGEEERHVCCVCAERRKGAAFIPCGHTFCRVCSRVLFKRRGSCPLCNARIVQVLHIF